MIIKSEEDLTAMMERRQDALNPPSPESLVWRYYPLDKFLSLITSNQLFFAPATSLQDPFEGDYGTAAKKQIRETFGDGQYLRDFNTFEFLRQHTYLSCWHESELESDAMWKLYGNSIAVKAKFSNISKLLTWSKTELKHCGRVNYIDYNSEYVHFEFSYLPYFFKRLSFVHEKEVRFLIQEYRRNWDEYPTATFGKLVPLNVNSDFDEIVLSPTMESYVADAIKKVLQQAGVSINVRQSVLLNRPVW
jgi:hypothetical protein